MELPAHAPRIETPQTVASTWEKKRRRPEKSAGNLIFIPRSSKHFPVSPLRFHFCFQVDCKSTATMNGHSNPPAYAPFFGYVGAAMAQVFTVFGAAYGTAKASVGIFNMGVMRPELVMKSVIPVRSLETSSLYHVHFMSSWRASLPSTDWLFQWF